VSLSALKVAGRVLVVALILAGMVTAWIYRYSLSPAEIESFIQNTPEAPLFFLLAHIVVSLLFIPRTLLSIAAGLVFGLWGGIFWATCGCLLGSVAGFLIARYVNDGLLDLESIPKLGPLLLRAEEGGWRAVAAIRLLPIMPHTLGNYALGLTRVPLGAYITGSVLGQLPATIAYVDFGAAGERVFAGKAGWLMPTLIGVAALLISMLLPRFIHRRS